MTFTCLFVVPFGYRTPIFHAPIKPLNHRGKYKYQSLNIQNHMHPSTQRTDVFHIPLRKNNDHFHIRGPGSAMGIATGYGRDGPGIESRWG